MRPFARIGKIRRLHLSNRGRRRCRVFRPQRPSQV